MKNFAWVGLLLISSIASTTTGAVNIDHNYNFGGEVGKSIVSEVEMGGMRIGKHMPVSNKGGLIDSRFSAKKAKRDVSVNFIGKWRVVVNKIDDLKSAPVEGALLHVMDPPSLRGRVDTLLGEGDRRKSYYERREYLNQRIGKWRFDARHVAPVPEPEIYAMLIVGAGLVGVMSRRRRKSAS
ncbi:MAG: PEP-CTERM sorting domain-containing protein [Candidatus Thiodiazotropha sp. (ex Ustalcina ferruginea)]|nr:PEP-CTERM sorting domain-containing protein [Candidatus Thiodiazotropha sp. (ex Ustalcina ferruginea)]